MEGFIILLVCTLYVLLCFWTGMLLKRHVQGRKNQILAGLAVYLVLTIALLFALFPHGVAHFGTKRVVGNIALIIVLTALLTGAIKLLEQRVQNKMKRFAIGLSVGLVWGLLFVAVNQLLR